MPPVTKEERMAWIKTYATSAAPIYDWLEQHATPRSKIIFLSSPEGIDNFPKNIYCGDWFARCKYSRFTQGYVNLKEWPELKPEVLKDDFSYIVIRWNFVVSDAKRPTPPLFSEGIPASTMACLEHIQFDGYYTDLFKIRDECKR